MRVARCVTQMQAKDGSLAKVVVGLNKQLTKVTGWFSLCCVVYKKIRKDCRKFSKKIQNVPDKFVEHFCCKKGDSLLKRG